MKEKSTKKLRIGDNWNAIRIIALSQQNPLKAVAEFVENSIDAKAKHVTLIRGKEKGAHFLRIKDDGDGIPRNAQGAPDFDYVATHICDSVKRRLKADGETGLQGEFGIGLLSFWTVGEDLAISSSGADGKTYQMHMKKGEPGYAITQRRVLVAEPGTELHVGNILPGIKQFSGEKIQWYLASELRDRIRHSGVEIRVIDRTARAEFKVEPRQFEGQPSLAAQCEGWGANELARSAASSYVAGMRRLSLLLILFSLLGVARLGAQNDAIARARQQEMEESQRRVNARLQALEEALQSIQQEMNALRADLRNQRDEPKVNPASQTALRQLEDRIAKVEQKTLEQFGKLERLITNGGARHAAPAPPSSAPKGKSYEYTIREGDTLSRIVADLKEQGLKISQKDVERANPKTDWLRLRIHSTIIIPVPEQ